MFELLLSLDSRCPARLRKQREGDGGENAASLQQTRVRLRPCHATITSHTAVLPRRYVRAPFVNPPRHKPRMDAARVGCATRDMQEERHGAPVICQAGAASAGDADAALYAHHRGVTADIIERFEIAR